MSATKRNSSSTSSTNTASPAKVCCFCNLTEDNELEYGKLYEQDGIVTHYYCLLLSSNMEQRGDDNEGILGFLAEDIHKELRRGKRLICSYCKRIGATLGCCNLKCKRIFHYPCGLKAGSLHQFFGEFKSFCVNHRPKQKIDEYMLKHLSTLHDIICYICYDKANPRDLMDTLWAPCCKKEAFFHRKCVQQLALSAGYFFKCPLCNNKKEFQNAMLQHGIFIPSQDASWELVPNAFEELLYRHDRCDATICLCPKGRKHTSSNAKWELLLCRICGSQGIHMACGKLQWANPVWECVECTSILSKTKDHENARTGDISDSSLSRDSDSDDSESDVSVGTDFPMVCSSPSPSFNLLDLNIKSRPGPRSFKLQQQLKACSMFEALIDQTRKSTRTSTTTATEGTTDAASKKNNPAEGSKKNNSAEGSKKNNSAEESMKNNSAEENKKSNFAVESKKSNFAEESKKSNSAGESKKNKSAEESKTCNSAEGSKKNNSAEESKKNDSAEESKKSKSAEESKKNKSAEKSKTNVSQQTSKKDPGELKRKSSVIDVKPQSKSSEKDVITIESDDDDDVEIISLKRKISIPTVQIAWANTFGSKKSSGAGVNSAGQSTSEVDPLQMEVIAQSSVKEVPKKRDGIKESNVPKSMVPSTSKITTAEQPSDVTASQKSTPVAAPSNNNDDLEAFMDTSSVMNIKITNVTSVPPELFASVPDVSLDEDVTWLQPDTVNMSSGDTLENWLVSQQSLPTTMKRSMHEEGNKIGDNSCKRSKGNSSDKTVVDIEARDIRREQIQRTEANAKIRKVADDTAQCAASKTTGPTSGASRHDTPAPSSAQKVADTICAAAKSAHHPKKSECVPKIIVQRNGEASTKLYAPVVQSASKQIFYSVPPRNIIYTQQVSSPANRETEGATVTYAATSSDVTRPPVIHNTATVNNRQSVVIAQPVPAINASNSQQAGGSSNQQAELSKEKTPDGPTADGDPSSRIVCDGGAGRTNPAVTPTRPACFSEAPITTGTAAADASEITGTEVGQRGDSPRRAGARKSSKRKGSSESDTMHIMSIISRIRSHRARCNVFPEVTNNHSACHQPRLIPQYTYLHDLKFRVRGTDDIQMVLYDTFSVNIPVDNPAKDNKTRPGTTAREPGRRPLTSQTRCQASAGLNHASGDSLASRLIDDMAERIVDATAVVAHDDAKENLDPVSRTVSRNVFPDNVSLMNGVDDEDATNDARRQREHDAQTRLAPSDTNSNALDRAICHITVDNNTGKDDNRNQDPQIDHRDGVQCKQTTMEDSGWLPYRRTIHSIDSDLNIARMNNNVEKILHNNLTVATSQRVDSKETDSSRATGDSLTSRSHLPHVTANHRRSNNHARSVSKSRNRNRSVANVPNITFNERSISNKQIDACDSSQLIRCVAFRDDDDEDSYVYNNDHTVRVSIDLHKIQNLIESSPELFVSDNEDVDVDGDSNDGRHRRKCISRLRVKDVYTQTKFHDTENNDGKKHSSFKNGELLTLGRANMERIETQDSLYANTFNRKRESRYFDRHNR